MEIAGNLLRQTSIKKINLTMIFSNLLFVILTLQMQPSFASPSEKDVLQKQSEQAQQQWSLTEVVQNQLKELGIQGLYYSPSLGQSQGITIKFDNGLPPLDVQFIRTSIGSLEGITEAQRSAFEKFAAQPKVISSIQIGQATIPVTPFLARLLEKAAPYYPDHEIPKQVKSELNQEVARFVDEILLQVHSYYQKIGKADEVEYKTLSDVIQELTYKTQIKTRKNIRRIKLSSLFTGVAIGISLSTLLHFKPIEIYHTGLPLLGITTFLLSETLYKWYSQGPLRELRRQLKLIADRWKKTEIEKSLVTSQIDELSYRLREKDSHHTQLKHNSMIAQMGVNLIQTLLLPLISHRDGVETTFEYLPTNYFLKTGMQEHAPQLVKKISSTNTVSHKKILVLEFIYEFDAQKNPKLVKLKVIDPQKKKSVSYDISEPLYVLSQLISTRAEFYQLRNSRGRQKGQSITLDEAPLLLTNELNMTNEKFSQSLHSATSPYYQIINLLQIQENDSAFGMLIESLNQKLAPAVLRASNIYGNNYNLMTSLKMHPKIKTAKILLRTTVALMVGSALYQMGINGEALESSMNFKLFSIFAGFTLAVEFINYYGFTNMKPLLHIAQNHFNKKASSEYYKEAYASNRGLYKEIHALLFPQLKTTKSICYSLFSGK